MFLSTCYRVPSGEIRLVRHMHKYLGTRNRDKCVSAAALNLFGQSDTGNSVVDPAKLHFCCSTTVNIDCFISSGVLDMI